MKSFLLPLFISDTMLWYFRRSTIAPVRMVDQGHFLCKFAEKNCMQFLKSAEFFRGFLPYGVCSK